MQREWKYMYVDQKMIMYPYENLKENFISTPFHGLSCVMVWLVYLIMNIDSLFIVL